MTEIEVLKGAKSGGAVNWKCSWVAQLTLSRHEPRRERILIP